MGEETDPGRRIRTVRLRGEIDHVNADAALSQIRALLGPGLLVVVDVSALDFLDSSGVSMLLQADRAARALGTRLRLAAPTRWLSELLDLAGLREMFEIHPTVAAALAAAEETAVRIDGVAAQQSVNPPRPAG